MLCAAQLCLMVRLVAFLVVKLKDARFAPKPAWVDCPESLLVFLPSQDVGIDC